MAEDFLLLLRSFAILALALPGGAAAQLRTYRITQATSDAGGMVPEGGTIFSNF